MRKDELPHIREALTVRINGQRRVMEVAQQVGDNTVRCIMLAASESLWPGAWRWRRTGQRHRACRWASQVLGRMFNVLGDAIDGGEPDCPQMRSAGHVHRDRAVL